MGSFFNRAIATRVAAALLAVGAVGGIADVTHASAYPTTVAQTVTTSSTTSSVSTATQARHGKLADILNQLVSQGTITASQEQAILSAWRQHHPPARIVRELHREIGRDTVKAAAQSLRLTPKQLHQDRKNGESIARIATAQGVPLSVVSTAITNAVQHDLNNAVTAHKMTQAQEQKLLSRFEAHLQTFLNAVPKQARGAADSSSSIESATSTTTAP